MRRDASGSVGLAFIILGLIAILAIMWLLLSPSSPIGVLAERNQYAPSVELTLYTNSAQQVYRADMHLDVSDPRFVDYLFAGSVGGEGGLPQGTHKLVISLYEGTPADRKETKLAERTFDIGIPDTSMANYTVKLPLMKLAGAPTSVHLWGYVIFDGTVIREADWMVDPADGTVTEGN